MKARRIRSILHRQRRIEMFARPGKQRSEAAASGFQFRWPD
jgi:hypothetical protein